MQMHGKTYMEILRVFVDVLEGLFNLRLVFFILQNSLPCRLLQHLVEFKHFINEDPVRYQN